MITPEIVYLFVALTGPLTGYPTHRLMYMSTDKQACEAQAKAWNEQIYPIKPTYFCFEHRPKKLELPSDIND